MAAPLADIDALYEAVKRLRAERAKMERLSEKARSAPLGKSSQKAVVDLDWQAAHVLRVEAEVHARAVDCGYADLREPAHYAERISHNSPFHKYPWTPAQPRGVANGERVS